ncbi:MAG: hypothetical protein IKS45_13430 [Thermoguttaceae bacterium]|nr:hypothetical protein [Thermoguttaceae bacterium]
MTKKKRITPKRMVQIRLNEAMQSFEQFFEHYGISESQRNEMIEKLNQSDKPYSKQALGNFLKMYILINGCIEEFEQNENPAGLHYFDCETICPWKGDLDVAVDPCDDEINQNLALASSVACASYMQYFKDRSAVPPREPYRPLFYDRPPFYECQTWGSFLVLLSILIALTLFFSILWVQFI